MPESRLLDLFCGAGGSAIGYHRAGFEIVGVDKEPQPNYPFQFVQADARSFLDFGSWNEHTPDEWFAACGIAGFAGIHASPPCQAFTDYRRKGYGVGDGYPNLIPEIRELLEATGLPYVIENVEGARSEMRDPVMLCGSMFGLDVRRHRLFETNWPLLQPPPCDHAAHMARGKRFPGATNRDGRYTCEIGVWRIPLETQKEAMGVDWDVTLKELSEQVPPAYTEHIGRQLHASVELADAA